MVVVRHSHVTAVFANMIITRQSATKTRFWQSYWPVDGQTTSMCKSMLSIKGKETSFQAP